MSASAVDVLMTVYNGSRYVRSAVASIQNQTLRDFTLHVVDDGSTDATRAILEEIAASDSRVRVHVKPNGGVVEAANFGLERCSSEFVARLDSDDLAYSDRLDRQVGFLRENSGVLAVSGMVRHIGPSGARLGTTAKYPPPEQSDASHIPAVEPYLMHPFVMVRR